MTASSYTALADGNGHSYPAVHMTRAFCVTVLRIFDVSHCAKYVSSMGRHANSPTSENWTGCVRYSGPD